MAREPTHGHQPSEETCQDLSRVKRFGIAYLNAMWTLECDSKLLNSESEQQQGCETLS